MTRLILSKPRLHFQPPQTPGPLFTPARPLARASIRFLTLETFTNSGAPGAPTVRTTTGEDDDMYEYEHCFDSNDNSSSTLHAAQWTRAEKAACLSVMSALITRTATDDPTARRVDWWRECAQILQAEHGVNRNEAAVARMWRAELEEVWWERKKAEERRMGAEIRELEARLGPVAREEARRAATAWREGCREVVPDLAALVRERFGEGALEVHGPMGMEYWERLGLADEVRATWAGGDGGNGAAVGVGLTGVEAGGAAVGVETMGAEAGGAGGAGGAGAMWEPQREVFPDLDETYMEDLRKEGEGAQ